MKYPFIIFIMALLFTLSLSPTSSHAATVDPASVVKGFYSWYLKNTEDYRKNISARKQDFEPKLYESLINAFRKGPDDIGWLDFDPFVNARVPAAGFAISKAQVQGPTARITVDITLSRGGKSSLIVVLKSHGGSWKISNLLYGKDSDLAGILRKVNGGR